MAKEFLLIPKVKYESMLKSLQCSEKNRTDHEDVPKTNQEGGAKIEMVVGDQNAQTKLNKSLQCSEKDSTDHADMSKTNQEGGAKIEMAVGGQNALTKHNERLTLDKRPKKTSRLYLKRPLIEMDFISKDKNKKAAHKRPHFKTKSKTKNKTESNKKNKTKSNKKDKSDDRKLIKWINYTV